MDNLTAIKLALDNMFKEKSHFSICTIDEICELLDIIPNKKDHQKLRLLHCIHYSDMTQQELNQLKELVLEVLEQAIPKIDIQEHLLEALRYNKVKYILPNVING